MTVRGDIQYKINDAQKYLFNVANPKSTLRQVVESAIRQVIGKNSMDYILIGDRGFRRSIGYGKCQCGP
jgi:membrane protease subunit HflK